MDSPTRTPRRDLPDEQGEVSVLRITDPTAVGDSVEVYDMDVINLDPEKFEYKQVTVPLEECALIYQHTNATSRTQSRISEDFDPASALTESN